MAIDIEIHVVGAGGTGSHVIAALKDLHFAREAHNQSGIKVILWDDDHVSEANLVRSNFYPNEIGMNKATALISRVNLGYGLEWKAIPEKVNLDSELWFKDNPYENQFQQRSDNNKIIISCLDSRKSRLELYKVLRKKHPNVAWMDIGNGPNFGQFVIGEVEQKHGSIPNAFHLMPELFDEKLDDPDVPSCSTLEALLKQDLLINKNIATQAISLLYNILMKGFNDIQGGVLNQQHLMMNPIYIDRKMVANLRKKHASYYAELLA